MLALPEALVAIPYGCACANSTSKAPISASFGGLCLLWHQSWSALTAPEWRLAEQTADRAIKESQSENKPDLPPPSHCLLDEDVDEDLYEQDLVPGHRFIIRTRPCPRGTDSPPHPRDQWCRGLLRDEKTCVQAWALGKHHLQHSEFWKLNPSFYLWLIDRRSAIYPSFQLEQTWMDVWHMAYSSLHYLDWSQVKSKHKIQQCYDLFPILQKSRRITNNWSLLEYN